VKRFADKTPEEIQLEQDQKRRAQLSRLGRIRIYQMGGIALGLFGYFYVYRRFLMPKTVFQSQQYV
jgi:hypothetical protein